MHPSSTRERARLAVRFVVLAGVLGAPAVSPALSEELLDCEQQAKRLADCCRGLPREGLVCVTEGCTNDEPAITPPEAVRCLEDLSCDAIRDRGLCASPSTCPQGGFVAAWEVPR